MQTGAVNAVIAGDTAGNIYSSYPLGDDGNYKFWVRFINFYIYYKYMSIYLCIEMVNG